LTQKLPGSEQERTGATLAKDLAESLRVRKLMVWCQAPLGSVHHGNSHESTTPIADVYSMVYQYNAPLATVYEVKVSRGDFLGDLNRGKYQRYLPHCNRLFFATPAGLVKPAEIPTEAGLMVCGANGWHTVKAAPRRPWVPDSMLLQSLLMHGFEEERAGRDLKDRERWTRNYTLAELAKEHGIAISHRIAEADDVLTLMEHLRQELSAALGRECQAGGLRYDIMALEDKVRSHLGALGLLQEVSDLGRLTGELLAGKELSENGRLPRWRAQEYARRLVQIGESLEHRAE